MLYVICASNPLLAGQARRAGLPLKAVARPFDTVWASVPMGLKDAQTQREALLAKEQGLRALLIKYA